MTFGCLSQIMTCLDQQNIKNAYDSGMKEDIQVGGNQLDFFATCFNVAYCITLTPSHIIMPHVRPSYWLPGLEMG